MTTAVFNCNYSCNDDCNFCFNKELLNHTPLMTLAEVQENYAYIIERYDIRNIIISGGEPSLHPDFWRLMVFFYYKVDTHIRPALNTNGILFSSQKLTDKIAKLIRLSPLSRKQISLSFSNIAHPNHPKNKKEQMKIDGIRNLLGADFGTARVFLSVIITRDNYTQLDDIAAYIKGATQTAKRSQISIDIRYLFIGMPSKYDRSKSCLSDDDIAEIMPDFVLARSHIEHFIMALNSLGFAISLKNLPICNFSQEVRSIPFSKYQGEKRLGVSSFAQMEKIEVPRDFFTPKRTIAQEMTACSRCTRNKECSIEREYLDLGIFSPLTPLDTENQEIV